MLVPDRLWNRAPFHAKASIKCAHWFDAAAEACQRERVLSSLRGHPVVTRAASTWCHHGKVFSDCLGSPSRGTQQGLRSRTTLQTGVRSETGIPGQDDRVSFGAERGEVSANWGGGVGREVYSRRPETLVEGGASLSLRKSAPFPMAGEPGRSTKSTG